VLHVVKAFDRLQFNKLLKMVSRGNVSWKALGASNPVRCDQIGRATFDRWATVYLPGFPIIGGRWYYEVEMLSRLDSPQIGFGTLQTDVSGQNGLGDDKNGWAVDLSRCKLWHEGPARDFGQPAGAGHTVCCVIDADAGTIRFGCDGNFRAPFGTAFSSVDADARLRSSGYFAFGAPPPPLYAMMSC